jgi:hypothetical protein
LKHYEPWFDDERLRFLDQRQQAKMQWLQDPKQSNLVNLNNVRHEASKHFRNKKEEYLKAKVDDCKVTVRPKNIRELCRGINDFMKGYQPGTDIVKSKEVVTNCHYFGKVEEPFLSAIECTWG